MNHRRFKYRGTKQAGPANRGAMFGGTVCRHGAPFNKRDVGYQRRVARRFKRIISTGEAS